MKKTILFFMLSILTMATFVSAIGSNYENGYDWTVRKTMLPMLCKSDINHDGLITQFDINLVLSHYNQDARQSLYLQQFDIDGSGVIGIRDFNLVKSWIGTNTSKFC